MPPPVPPGDAPININAITNNNVAFVNAPVAIVLKPAVLAATD